MANGGSISVLTPHQMRAHINALTQKKAAFTKMVRNADFRVLAMGEGSRGRTGDELLNEAILACLEGRRKCPTSIPFEQFLRSVIRSIASHWCEEHETSKTIPDSHTVDQETGESIIERTGSLPNMEDYLDFVNVKDTIKEMFSGDKIVEAIVDGLADGLDGPKIQAKYSITRNEYEYGLVKIRKREEWIRRKL